LGSRIFAAVKGMLDAGVNVKADEKAFPKEERLTGKHIEDFAKADPSKNNTVQFGSYKRQNVDASAFSKMVEEAKATIDKAVRE
jgi:large subunit ribosomal protein L18